MDNKVIIIFIFLLLISTNANAFYFNTDRQKKIIGPLLTKASQINEIQNFSNAFGAAPNKPSDITDYLNGNSNEMLPVIGIDKLLFDSDTGMFHHDVSLIVDAIKQSVATKTEILFLIDEPLWTVRKSCLKNKHDACYDIENRYAATLSTMRVVGQLLRKHFPGSGVLHIESWAELVFQKNEFPNEKVIMLDEAEYLGFDCYGNFYSCGSEEYGYYSHLEYGSLVWDTMQDLELANPIGRKMFIVAGAFLAENYFSHPEEITHLVLIYTRLLDNVEMIGGLGIFLWGDFEENGTIFYGARSNEKVRDFINSTFKSRK
ncbi:hypothetical protein [Nitrosomonas sp.]|uniref:hypothetical protein n=1 Tax=Nitrosomonas sp. TaxID=42353 RepID=UPI00284EC878|nr:hypothetical protein [Nitrosomonas sp.]MDR4515439.1 hypothetical protein [Nitrosomonas sp.]